MHGLFLTVLVAPGGMLAIKFLSFSIIVLSLPMLLAIVEWIKLPPNTGRTVCVSGISTVGLKITATRSSSRCCWP